MISLNALDELRKELNGLYKKEVRTEADAKRMEELVAQIVKYTTPETGKEVNHE
jgi:hypothetical protein